MVQEKRMKYKARCNRHFRTFCVIMYICFMPAHVSFANARTRNVFRGCVRGCFDPFPRVPFLPSVLLSLRARRQVAHHARTEGVFRAHQGTYMVALKCRLLSVKLNLKSRANVTVSECTARYRVVI